jgi:hypothetical protein
MDKGETVGDCTTDCRSEVGVTVGLIDGLIAIARVLAQRDLSPAEAQEALADLRADEDMARVLGPNDRAHRRDGSAADGTSGAATS